MDVKEEGLIHGDIGSHWYYKSKAKAVLKMLKGISFSSLLDVGAGSGFFSKYLLRETAAQQATCVDTAYEKDTVEAVNGKPVRFVRAAENTQADLVLLMDVLEHVDDDHGLLAQSMAGAKAGAYCVITVPAFKFLWSGHDDFLGHKRRYTLSSLRKLVASAGLEIKSIHYFYGLVFPLVVAIRMLQKLRKNRPAQSDMRQHSAAVNGILSTACAAETGVMRLNKLMGLSVCCLCRKP